MSAPSAVSMPVWWSCAQICFHSCSMYPCAFAVPKEIAASVVMGTSTGDQFVMKMAVGCSYVRVPTPEGDVIARTMELGAAVKNGTLPTWTLAVHPSLEQLGKSGTCANMGAKAFAGTHGFVSLDLSPGPGSPYPEAIPTDGINAVGLTISQHTLQQSVYQDPNMSPHHRERICFADFTAWVLSSFATVGELATALNKSIVVSSGASYTAPYGLHWAIDDAEGG